MKSHALAAWAAARKMNFGSPCIFEPSLGNWRDCQLLAVGNPSSAADEAAPQFGNQFTKGIGVLGLAWSQFSRGCFGPMGQFVHQRFVIFPG